MEPQHNQTSENKEDEINAVYKATIESNRSRIQDSLLNAIGVFDRLHHLGIVDSNDKNDYEATISYKAQKSMIITAIIQAGYHYIVKIIDILDRTSNCHLGSLFSVLDQELRKKFEGYNPSPPNQIVTDGANNKPKETDPLQAPEITICCHFYDLYLAVLHGNPNTLQGLLEKEMKKIEAVGTPCDAAGCAPNLNGATIIHAAVAARNPTDALDCLKLLVEQAQTVYSRQINNFKSLLEALENPEILLSENELPAILSELRSELQRSSTYSDIDWQDRDTIKMEFNSATAKITKFIIAFNKPNIPIITTAAKEVLKKVETLERELWNPKATHIDGNWKARVLILEELEKHFEKVVSLLDPLQYPEISITPENLPQILCAQRERNSSQLTPMHIVAKWKERIDIMRYMYENYKCDILITNGNGDTVLDLINKHMPEYAWEIHTKNTLSLFWINNDTRDDIKLEIDFGTIIGYSLKPARNVSYSQQQDLPSSRSAPKTKKGQDPESQASTSAREKSDSQAQISPYDHAMGYNEMLTLAKIVHSRNKDSEALLAHVMVKAFLELKWNKMKRRLIHPLLGIRLLIYICYTLYIISSFVVDCPHSSQDRFPHSSPSNNNEGNGFLSTVIKLMDYFLGTWWYDAASDSEPNCSFGFGSLAFMVCGILLLLKEIVEVWALSKIKLEDKRIGLRFYFKSWENRFQIISDLLMIWIGTVCFYTAIPTSYYVAAVISIILVGALIFLQLGEIAGEGINVQLFGQIIKRFSVLMLNNSVWIIVFAVSLSIIFPRDKSFQTFPKSMSRVITMMSGELDYVSTVYGTDKGKLNDSPLIELIAHVGIILSAVFLLIILSNALIGLVVHDVPDLKKRSNIKHRCIQVNTLYVCEAFLLIFGEPSERFCVMSPKHIWKTGRTGTPGENGMVWKGTLNELIPHKIRKEIREFAMKGDEYKYDSFGTR